MAASKKSLNNTADGSDFEDVVVQSDEESLVDKKLREMREKLRGELVLSEEEFKTSME